MFQLWPCFRCLSLRLPSLKLSVIRCLAVRMQRNLESASVKDWQVLMGHLTFAAQLSQDAKFMKKVGVIYNSRLCILSLLSIILEIFPMLKIVVRIPGK